MAVKPFNEFDPNTSQPNESVTKHESWCMTDAKKRVLPRLHNPKLRMKSTSCQRFLLEQLFDAS
eukprot:5152317-Amphidinium_carterae.1